MEDRRQHSRRTTELQLEVFDLNTTQRLGRVVDLSTDGFMLFSETPPQVDSVIECCLTPAAPIDGIREVILGADCLWTRPAADNLHHWAGFHIIDLAEEHAEALKALLKRL
ncbi:PilZ domain-containing protein [Zestomonas carbonaria]|uniref:PilZ domain-containing protein n=1 Tax=Zestomonas carbonaria TaxID=2762745 RepID=A0A7U7EMU4_9GAMM|nr:PilZ domain-containing protein [Pseudomonas carbonaria]CAD5107933.1 hypothetical protein PSEWESI4_02213 [Pseudomonas carbonaria]